MSESILLQHTVNKPGTSCLGCRRRKLKCSREAESCNHCTKSALPCVYPFPEPDVRKRKRGPYKKDKPPRQRHLEDLVRYLEPRDPDAGGDEVAGLSSSDGNPPAVRSEDLVKDALIALTKSSASEHDTRYDDGRRASRVRHVGSGGLLPAGSGEERHPSVAHIFEYWHLFVTRVDPMVKVIHCPTFATEKLFPVLDCLGAVVPRATEMMLISIYYAALSTCTAREVRTRFGDGQDALMLRYSRLIQAAAGDDVADFEALQALVLYMICVRREEKANDHMGALFALAVQSAETIGLHEEPEGTYTPYQCELRRRLWYHLCGLESRTAEESGSRTYALLRTHQVQLPSNINDHDLHPHTTIRPHPRPGVTDMTFPILRFEIHRLIFTLQSIRKSPPPHRADALITQQQQSLYDATVIRLEHLYTQHMHPPSRPYDQLCTHFLTAMFTKARLLIAFPAGPTLPPSTPPSSARAFLLRSSVHIIQHTHALATDPRLALWAWFFRGYVQWHSLAIVVAELGWRTEEEEEVGGYEDEGGGSGGFGEMAWKVLDPILKDWDGVFEGKRGDWAWERVGGLIERAREARRWRRRRAAMGGTEGEGGVGSSWTLPQQRGVLDGSVPTLSTESMVVPSNDFHRDFGRHGITFPTHSNGPASHPTHPLPHPVPPPPAELSTHLPCTTPPPILDQTALHAFDYVFNDTTWRLAVDVDTDMQCDGGEDVVTTWEPAASIPTTMAMYGSG